MKDIKNSDPIRKAQLKDWINTPKTERKKILQQEKKNNKALSNLHELFDENVQLKEEIKKMRKEKQEMIAKIKKAKIQQVLKFDRKRVELIEKFETLNSPCKTFIIVIFHITIYYLLLLSTYYTLFYCMAEDRCTNYHQRSIHIDINIHTFNRIQLVITTILNKFFNSIYKHLIMLF